MTWNYFLVFCLASGLWAYPVVGVMAATSRLREARVRRRKGGRE